MNIKSQIKYWAHMLDESCSLNESIYNKSTVLRDYNNNVAHLDSSLAKKLEIHLDIFKTLIEDLPDVNLDGAKEIPLEN